MDLGAYDKLPGSSAVCTLGGTLGVHGVYVLYGINLDDYFGLSLYFIISYIYVFDFSCSHAAVKLLALLSFNLFLPIWSDPPILVGYNFLTADFVPPILASTFVT